MHGPAILNEIETKKLSHDKTLQKKKNKTVCRSKFDPRAKADRITNTITDNELDILFYFTGFYMRATLALNRLNYKYVENNRLSLKVTAFIY